MKKIAIIFALAFALSATNVFADHPKGWGIGVVGGWNMAWAGSGSPGFGLSLKAPQLPIFWGVALGFNADYFGLNITGDYYFIDKLILPEANLHWFLGLGGYFGFQSWTMRTWYGGYYDDTWMHFAFGARVPIGLSWQPLKFLEVFLNVAPSLGIGFWTDSPEHNGWRYQKGGPNFPVGGLGLDLGVRFWL